MKIKARIAIEFEADKRRNPYEEENILRTMLQTCVGQLQHIPERGIHAASISTGIKRGTTKVEVIGDPEILP
jgi:hypothetical protein